MPKGETTGTGGLAQQPQSEAELEAFKEFFHRYFDVLRMYALKVGATVPEAEEAAAEAMTQAFMAWPRLTAPLDWATRATWTSLVKARQRDRKRLQATERAVREGRLRAEADDDPYLNVWEDSPWVKQLLGLLPPAQREVMEHAMELLSPAEIAELLGKTPETIRGNLFKARQTLKAELERRGVHRSSAMENVVREEIR